MRGHGTWPFGQWRIGVAGNAANGKCANGHAVFTDFWYRIYFGHAGGGGYVQSSVFKKNITVQVVKRNINIAVVFVVYWLWDVDYL